MLPHCQGRTLGPVVARPESSEYDNRPARVWIIGSKHAKEKKRGTMYDEHKTRTTQWPWLAILGVVGMVLVTSAVPGYAWYRGGVYVRPSIVVPLGPYWEPYPYYPPVVVTPPPQVYGQPAPQTPNPPPPAPSYWYYCEEPQGYYPYVQQCPGGWRPVAPTPPSP